MTPPPSDREMLRRVTEATLFIDVLTSVHASQTRPLDTSEARVVAGVLTGLYCLARRFTALLDAGDLTTLAQSAPGVDATVTADLTIAREMCARVGCATPSALLDVLERTTPARRDAGVIGRTAFTALAREGD